VFEEVFTKVLKICIGKCMVNGYRQTVGSAPTKANALKGCLELKVPEEEPNAHL
tara:strand:- start:304 stop:465 length:162 start_codon:yes stop_codon:yes gene_type:complete